MTRVLLFFFVIIPCCGFSALQWIKRFLVSRSTMNPQDHDRVLHFFGITDPRLDPIWEVATDYHHKKDVGSEWGKLDVQRAFKFLCLLILFWVAVSVLLAVALIVMVLL